MGIFNVQQEGSSLQTAKKGAAAARRMLAEISNQPRVSLPWDKLLVSLECGGSDAMSGVTANVAMGAPRLSEMACGKQSVVILFDDISHLPQPMIWSLPCFKSYMLRASRMIKFSSSQL